MSDDVAFDYGRLDATLYNDLGDARDKVKFMDMVEAYVDHLRADPTTSPGYDQDTEDMGIQSFLEMVDSDVAWGLARTMVPEFQCPMYSVPSCPRVAENTADCCRSSTDSLPPGLQTIIDALKQRIESVTSAKDVEVSSIQAVQEAAGLRRFKTAVQWVGYIGGEKSQTSPEQVEEVDQLINDAVNIRVRLENTTAQTQPEAQTSSSEEQAIPEGSASANVSPPGQQIAPLDIWSRPRGPKPRRLEGDGAGNVD